MVKASPTALPESSWVEKCSPSYMPRTGKPHICDLLLTTLLLEARMLMFVSLLLSPGETHQATDLSC